MIYELAVYFKLLVLCDYFNEYERYLDAVLESGDSLSDVIVDLSFSGSDEKRVFDRIV